MSCYYYYFFQQIKWFVLIPIQYCYFRQSADAELRIPNVTLSSAGVYTCRANNVAGIESKKLRLQVKGPPPIVKAGRQKSSVPGQTVILTCSVTSSLPYNLTWLRIISNSGKIHYKFKIIITIFIFLTFLNYGFIYLFIFKRNWTI